MNQELGTPEQVDNGERSPSTMKAQHERSETPNLEVIPYSIEQQPEKAEVKKLRAKHVVTAKNITSLGPRFLHQGALQEAREAPQKATTDTVRTTNSRMTGSQIH